MHNLDRPRLLLVEDDRVLGPLIAELLADDFDVQLAPDGQKGLHLGLTASWDAMVIDRGLPVMNGLDLVRALRRKGITTPAIILTALGATAEKIEGLDAGANDYMTKPFDAGELRARLRALTRSFAAQPPASSKSQPSGSLSSGAASSRAHASAISASRAQLDVGDWVLDPGTRSLRSSYGHHVGLTAKESELLALLAANPDKVFTRAELLESLFHPTDSQTVIDTYVHYLRKKISKSVIRTVHGLGYQLGDGA